MLCAGMKENHQRAWAAILQMVGGTSFEDNSAYFHHIVPVDFAGSNEITHIANL